MDDHRSQIRADPPPETLAWAAERLGTRARVDAWMILEGGGACALHALDVVDGRGVRHPLVLKRFVRADWLAREPDVAAREAQHLRCLEAVDLPIPRLIGVDPDGGVCDHPAILMTRLPGRPELAPDDVDAWLRGMLAPLIALHALGDEVVADFAAYRSYNDPSSLEVPAWSKRPEVWKRVIARVRDAQPGFVPRFVHRDYHPTNILWTGRRVTGVLDFTDASRGPAAIDLGHCRLNLAQLHGPDVADRFLAMHEALAPGEIGRERYWDLLSLIEILPGPDAPYWGWTNLGAVNLTTRIIRERLDAYAARVVANLD